MYRVRLLSKSPSGQTQYVSSFIKAVSASDVVIEVVVTGNQDWLLKACAECLQSVYIKRMFLYIVHMDINLIT